MGWTLPRAVHRGKVIGCLELLPTGSVTYGLVGFLTSSKPSPMSNCSRCTPSSSGSNSIRRCDGSTRGGTLHLTQAAWPASMMTLCCPTLRRPWVLGLMVCTQLTMALVLSVWTEMAPQSRVMRVGMSRSGCPRISSSSTLKPSSVLYWSTAH